MAKSRRSRKSRKHRKRGSRRLKKYVKAMRSQQAAQAPSVPAVAGGYVNDAVPDSSTLLAYKLLKDSIGPTNSAVFQDMLENELKYLIGGIAILKNDAKIAGQMGGETMANAAKLAQVLKNKTREIDLEDRIKGVATDILYHEYSKPGKQGLIPERIDSSFLAKDNQGNISLQYRVSGATDRGVNINAAQVPGRAAFDPIAPRAVAPDALFGVNNALGNATFAQNFMPGNLLLA